MKILEKTVTLGEKEFKVATDRDIAVKSFEQFPDLMEYLLNKQGQQFDDQNKFFLDAIKNKELSKLFAMEDKIGGLIAYALPLMLAKAKDNSNAKEIIDYAVENEVDDVFNSRMLEFLVQGFTQREQGKKPKVQFSMK